MIYYICEYEVSNRFTYIHSGLVYTRRKRNPMKYEISKSYLCRSDRYDDFYIIKATSDNGVSKYYEGYSQLYRNLLNGNTPDTKCSSLNGDVIENSPIYQTSNVGENNRTMLTQFIHGVKMEETFSLNITNELMEYTEFSPASFDEFMKILSIGKNYLNVGSADTWNTSTDGDALIGIQYANEYKDIPNDEDHKNSYKHIHRFMDKDGICYYLLMKVDGIYIPFLLREFDPMA